MVFGPDKPECVISQGTLNNDGTDENVSAVLKYSEGKIAVFTTHTKVKLNNSANIYGTKGMIKVISKRDFSIDYSTIFTLIILL